MCFVTNFSTNFSCTFSLSLSTDSAKKVHITEVRDCFTLYTCLSHLSLSLSYFLALSFVCMDLLNGSIHCDIRGDSSNIMQTFAFPFTFFMPDAVTFWSGPSPREKDWPQEGRCLRRDNIQEGRVFSSSVFLFLKYCFQVCQAS